jgi:cytochrome c oxidase subunit 1
LPSCWSWHAPQGLAWLFPTQDFFRTALVVHVDQSILIWFLAFAGVIWGLAPGIRLELSRLGLAGATLGCLLVAASPFLGASARELNNYVPVLDAPVFFWGLGLFALGSLLQVSAYFLGALPRIRLIDPIAVGGATAAFAALIAAISLVWSWIELAQTGTGISYELLFWGPGHVLQFVYTQIMLVAWLWLARDLGYPLALPDRWLSGVLILGVLPLVAVPLIHTLYPPGTGDARIAFTRLMQFGNGLAVIPLGLLLVVALIRRRGSTRDQSLAPRVPGARRLLDPIRRRRGAGGGHLRAEYHHPGPLPRVHRRGDPSPDGSDLPPAPHPWPGPPAGWMARVQPWIYGSGQLLHIGGLAASGAMGIQRKTAGAAQGLDTLSAKAAMGVMGIGGLLAVVGGILFVLVIIKAFIGRPARRAHGGPKSAP